MWGIQLKQRIGNVSIMGVPEKETKAIADMPSCCLFADAILKGVTVAEKKQQLAIQLAVFVALIHNSCGPPILARSILHLQNLEGVRFCGVRSDQTLC